MSDNLAYQDDFVTKRREEVIDGKPVMISPRPTFNHNQAAGNIFGLFWDYLRGKPCVPIADGMDLYLDEDNRFIPDFMVVCDRDKIKGDGIYGAPDFVVEVLSPSTAKNDRVHKKDVYEQCGVREYWIVDPANRTVEVYLLQNGRYVLDNLYTHYSTGELEKMSEKDRAALVTQFQCSLYDDLDISLEDIFYRTFEK